MILFLFAIVALIVLFVMSVYNSLASGKIKIKEAWSQIDVQLKRRVDLIPNLVETVKSYASHEKELFENVTNARSRLMGASNAEEAGEADIALTGALGKLFAIAENYPELKAQEGFLNLQSELSDTEDKVSYARQFFNAVVRDYNQKLVMFPSNVVAKAFSFSQEAFFEATPEDREPVKVAFK